MTYDNEFYKMYREYLREKTVRNAHNWIFKIVMQNPDFQNVVDLGCGLSEFLTYANPKEYIGIDVNAETTSKKHEKRTVKGDYRKGNLEELVSPSNPTAFISLFSVEIIAPKEANYKLYKEIFENFPSIKSGLVSGFYYVSKKDKNPIGETGGIQSYQTLENPEDVISNVFSEKRIILPVPSKMFGSDVYEVWKFLERK